MRTEREVAAAKKIIDGREELKVKAEERLAAKLA